MSLVFRAAVIGAIPLLGACGFLTDSVYVEGSETSSGAYSPAYTDDGETSFEDHLYTTGLTGFVGNSDGSISEIRV